MLHTPSSSEVLVCTVRSHNSRAVQRNIGVKCPRHNFERPSRKDVSTTRERKILVGLSQCNSKLCKVGEGTPIQRLGLNRFTDSQGTSLKSDIRNSGVVGLHQRLIGGCLGFESRSATKFKIVQLLLKRNTFSKNVYPLDSFLLHLSGQK